ncbi:TRAP-type C4-dicarboxylate transport system, small permease component [Vibrio xiamenensis]|uniref:TRAP transporter small permease protein n=1 Tax=Vibrio xiamenensis TaxID=861298 RepID=A0A1G7ZZG5_9VIBR|nr:TRAP transporter small permease [Vibrio xiamenensis]SDH14085.1 TRAP-type C4-dicarboxylate transport system, small permease component [Vibrio xiamenensis]
MSTINLINEGVNKALRVTLTLFMVVMIAAVVWQVFTRFVLQDPSNFTDELSRYLLMWIGILGGAYTFAIKRHLALELLSPRFGRRGQLVLSMIINCIIIAFSSIAFIYGGSVLVSNTLSHGQISPGIILFGHHLLIGYVYMVVPLAGCLISYFGFVDVVTAALDLKKKEVKLPAEGSLS